jgi:hypothetical protein
VETRNPRVDDDGNPIKRARDDGGRFTAKELADEAFGDEESDHGFVGDEEPDAHNAPPGEAEVKPAKPAPRPPSPEPKPEPAKFRFADQDFTSQQEAEQNVRSLRGMFRPLQEAKTKLERELAESDSIARQWSDKFRDMAVGKLSKGDQAALLKQLGVEQAAGSASPSDDILDGIDMDAVEMLAADPEAGFKVAMRYLAQELLGAVQNKIVPGIESRVQQTVAPYVQDRATAEQAVRIDSLIETVSQYRNPATNDFAFPELRDPQGVLAVGDLWLESEPPETLETPGGWVKAVGHYRLMQSLRGQMQPSVGVPGAVPAGPVPAPGVSASLSSDVRGGGAQPNRPRVSREHAALIEALDKVGEMDDSLGFQRNRRLSSEL